MRSLTLIVTSLILTAATGAFAQYPEIDPRTLPAQVSAQELTVQTGPGNKDWQAWLKLSVLLEDSGRFRESEDAYLHTISLLRAPAPLTVADVFDHMGTMYIQSGQLSKAEPVVRHALAIREHQNDTLGTGVSHMHLAMLLLGEKDLHSAEAEARTAVDMLVPESHLSTAASATPEHASATPAEHASATPEHASATPEHASAGPEDASASPEDASASPEDASASPEQKMNALIDLALIECASGAADVAVPRLRSALEIAHANYPENSSPVGYINFLLGYAMWKTGNTGNTSNSEAAAELMSNGVRTLAAEIGWGHPAFLNALRQYRTFLLETKQQTKARQITAEIEKLNPTPVAVARIPQPAY